MFGIAMSSAKLFFAGKLFKDNKTVMRQMLIGAALGIVAGIVVGIFAPVWVGAVVAGALSGLAQPMLFKDLKYA